LAILAVLARDISFSYSSPQTTFERRGPQSMTWQRNGMRAGIPLAKTAKIAKEEWDQPGELFSLIPSDLGEPGENHSGFSPT
jgi:hypothetical protein